MKIGIVGSGYVGATAAYALIMRGVGREIVLIDKDEARAKAEADDLLHAVPFAHQLEVRAGGYPDLEDAKVVLLTAGVGQRPGETRLELLGRNADVFRSIVPPTLEQAPEAVLVVATNPVDVLTHLSAQIAVQHGAPRSRVLGSGTTLDTARLRSLLGRHVGVDPHHVHAYVVGEHGDSEVLTWSLATIGGMPLARFCAEHDVRLDDAVRAGIDAQVRQAAYRIIEGKGATYYGIGSALARIVQAILADQRAILTVCAPAEQAAGVNDVTVSLPRLVGGGGVLGSFPLPVDEDEMKALSRSAQVVRDAIEAIV